MASPGNQHCANCIGTLGVVPCCVVGRSSRPSRCFTVVHNIQATDVSDNADVAYSRLLLLLMMMMMMTIVINIASGILFTGSVVNT